MNKTRLIDMFHCFSIASFFRSIGTIFHTFFCSISHRRYLITTILLIATWSTSILIGILHSSHFAQGMLVLENFDNYKKSLACDFDHSYKPVSYYCTTRRYSSSSSSSTASYDNTNKNSSNSNSNYNHMFLMDDMIFLLLLLVIPNFVVLLSYSWVCYTVWSSSRRFSNWTINACMKRTIDQHEERAKKQPMNGDAPDQPFESDSLLMKRTNTFVSKNGGASGATSSCARQQQETTLTTIKIVKFQPNLTQQCTIKKRNIYITLSTFLMIFCFSVCWTPFFIFPIFYTKIDDTNLYNNIKVFVHLIGYSSSVLNPIILITKSKRFKPKLQVMMKRLSSWSCSGRGNKREVAQL
jgi:hypothetical protein